MYLTYKNIGETPLECLERVRLEYGKTKDIPMTYAGRLDPMAEGLMIILVGEDCKKKDEYLRMDKEYELELLFGVSTDSYDVLGAICNIDRKSFDAIDFTKYVGKFMQEYPKYSSKVISMVGIGNEVPDELPSKEVEIFGIEQIGSRVLSGQRISEQVIQNIRKVNGDFRQDTIVKAWEKFASEYSTARFMIIKLRVSCSSGTYMRSLANRVGSDMGIPSLAFSIKRTRINGYKI